MCINPSRFTNPRTGLQVEVACRKCWQCKRTRVQDLVGRCIAETETCGSSRFATLTYGQTLAYGEKIEDLASKVLIYRDVQLWLKLMRKHHGPFRYLVAGEYGTAKGRSHWHCLLFFDGKAPEVETDWQGIEWKPAHWPHGFIQWDPGEVTAKVAAYVTKYLLKNTEDEEAQGKVAMSKKPPLGAHYFDWRADELARQALPLNDGYYSFPDVREYKSGLPREFMLHGAMVERYCRAYISAWRRRRGSNPPLTEYLEAFYNRNAIVRSEWKPDRTVRIRPRPFLEVPEGWQLDFFETVNNWAISRDGKRLWWSFDQEGNRAWRGEIVTETQAKALREAYAERNSSDAYREASGRSIERRGP